MRVKIWKNIRERRLDDKDKRKKMKSEMKFEATSKIFQTQKTLKETQHLALQIKNGVRYFYEFFRTYNHMKDKPDQLITVADSTIKTEV
jgi:hypothetical protein